MKPVFKLGSSHEHNSSQGKDDISAKSRKRGGRGMRKNGAKGKENEPIGVEDRRIDQDAKSEVRNTNLYHF